MNTNQKVYTTGVSSSYFDTYINDVEINNKILINNR